MILALTKHGFLSAVNDIYLQIRIKYPVRPVGLVFACSGDSALGFRYSREYLHTPAELLPQFVEHLNSARHRLEPVVEMLNGSHAFPHKIVIFLRPGFAGLGPWDTAKLIGPAVKVCQNAVHVNVDFRDHSSSSCKKVYLPLLCEEPPSIF